MFVRAATVAFAAALTTCSSPPARPDHPNPPAQAGPVRPDAQEPEQRFSPEVVRAPEGSPITLVLAAFRESQPLRAASIAETALADAATEERDRPYLRYLLARAMDEGESEGDREAVLGPLAASDHPLASYARIELAEAQLNTDPAAARLLLAPLVSDDGFPGRRRAQLLEATAYLRQGREQEAETRLRRSINESPEGAAAAPFVMPLAELLASRDSVSARVEALSLYRRVAMRAPLSRVGRRAEEAANAVLASLPRNQRRELRHPPAALSLARAQALADAMRHRDAENAFAEVAERTEDPILRCRARLGQGRAIYHRRQRTRAADLLAEVARDCDEPEVRAWARYLAGRGYRMASDRARAIEQWDRLETEVPTHSLADDARLRSARALGAQGRNEEMLQRLRTMPTRYPQGDMIERGQFLLAWRLRSAGQREDALAQLDQMVERGSRETREDLRGRAPYWRACLLAELGRMEEAVRAWTQVATAHPLSYYGQRALSRLQENDPEAATGVTEAWEVQESELAFPWRDEFESAGFQRALALLRVEENALAQREFQSLEAAARQNGELDEELRWVRIALLNEVGDYSLAVHLSRAAPAFRSQPPSGDSYGIWRVAYPRAFAPLIDEAAAEREIPAELVRAIAREESGFRPDAVSVAHAYGLTQLILPTARRWARELNLTATPATLQQPAINVRVGAAFMAHLWNRYRGNPAIAVPAYNAGQGATDRWIRERPSQRLDEWVEEIPYDETRRYTRRVIQSWGVYAWLDEGRLPALPATLPNRIHD